MTWSLSESSSIRRPKDNLAFEIHFEMLLRNLKLISRKCSNITNHLLYWELGFFPCTSDPRTSGRLDPSAFVVGPSLPFSGFWLSPLPPLR